MLAFREWGVWVFFSFFGPPGDQVTVRLRNSVSQSVSYFTVPPRAHPGTRITDVASPRGSRDATPRRSKLTIIGHCS